MLEKLIFNIVACALFIVIFFIMARKNNTMYLCLLGVQAFGIFLFFVELNFGWFTGTISKLIEYLTAIIIPGVCLYLEKKNIITYPEIVAIGMDKYYRLKDEKEKALELLLNISKKNINSSIVAELIANRYKEEGNYEAAIVEYLKIVNRNDYKDKSYYNLIKLYKLNEQEDLA